ncbi:protein TIS11-like isoform X2 [Varroa jacobsoni]|nr:protein TIS11-like isoform X2 [Varroa destructor]XP_022707491.1 protein TIS11-like isoform X2 [Varroa jacobsoni]
MCHYLAEQGRCPFGDQCTYAHSRSEVRFIERHPKHKTLPCRDFSTVGFCPFGERCSFIHYKRDPEDILKSAYALCQQQAVAAEPSFSTTHLLRSPSVTLTKVSAQDSKENLANDDTHQVESHSWSASWTEVGMHCANAFPLSSAEPVTQELLQVPSATLLSVSWPGSMSSSPHSSSGFPTTPSLSPLCSRSGHSMGSISRTSSSSDLSESGASLWPSQLHFAQENSGPGLAQSHSDIFWETGVPRITSRCSSGYGQRLPVFRDISSKDEEGQFNLHSSSVDFS